AYAAVLGFAFAFAPSGVAVRLLILYGMSILAMPLLLTWVFQGHNQMATVAAANVIRQGIFAAVVFGFVRTTGAIWYVPAAEIAAVAGAAGFCVWQYRQRFVASVLPARRVSRHIFREGGAIGLGQMFWAVRMYGGVIVLGQIASAEDVGLFAAA